MHTLHYITADTFDLKLNPLTPVAPYVPLNEQTSNVPFVTSSVYLNK